MYTGVNVQWVLSSPSVAQESGSPLWPTIVGSAAVAAALLSLLLHIWVDRKSASTAKLARRDSADVQPSPKGFADRISLHVRMVGGITIFMYKVTRLAAIAALLALVVFTSCKTRWTQVNIVLAEALILATALAAVDLSVTALASRTIHPHLWFVTLAAFAAYAYRDLWPLMTYTLRPMDEAEGAICWIKVALAMWAGVLSPLLEPYPYIPLNHKGQKFPANPEQTASILSSLFYTFLDPVVWRAYRLPHLAHDQLPPLADYDEASYLTDTHYQHLDPFSGAKRGSMLWAILKVLRVPLTYQTLCILMTSTSRLASPLGVNRLLNYLETRGQDAFIKPWVWVLLIALGPITNTVFGELFLFFSTRSLIRVEALLTSLVFDHALRLRMKAEISDSKEGGQSSTSPDGKAKKGGNLVGKIMNMATSDLNNITGGRNFLTLVISVPLQITLSMWFLYSILGWSALVGLAVMIFMVPAPKKVAQLMSRVQKQLMQAMDSRIQLVSEMMNVLRMVKLFGWEKRAQQDVAERREEELKFIRKKSLYALINHNVNFFMPMIHMIVTFATFTLIMKRSLTASIVFSSITAFKMLSAQLRFISAHMTPVISSYVSLNRLGDFLWTTELLDTFDESSLERRDVPPSQVHKQDIGFGHSEFSWSAHADVPDPARQPFRLCIKEDVVFKRGALNLIIGPTGSGKTSALMALLGEMHDIPLGPDAWVNLPRQSGVAYAAQESWVMSDSIKGNILFGAPYDEERYKQVIYQCALVPDLRMFKSGDETQVGERGITLSGGQKARVTLARAVYSSAEILLLDDVLAALDVHTSRWIVNKCFKNGLLKGRTVILVTHNIALTSPLADFILAIGPNGQVRSQGSSREVLGKDAELEQEISHEAEALEFQENEEVLEDSKATAADSSIGKLVVAEEIALGRVGWDAYKLYLSNVGGILSFWVPYVTANLATQGFEILDVWWLGWWAQQYATAGHGRVNVPFYIGIYTAIVVAGALLHVCRTVVQLIGSLRAGRIIHDKLMSSIMGSTFRWLDVTPISRIITRCTQDIQAIDGPIPTSFGVVFNMGLSLTAKMILILVYTSAFLPPALFIVVFGIWVGRIYIKAQMSVKREMSNRKAPVLETFGSAIQGLISIRAYGAQQAFKEQLRTRINDYTRAGRIFWCCNRWIATRLDALSAIFGGCVAFYFVYGGSNPTPSSVGFVLTMAVSFTDVLMNSVHWLNQLEVNANSLERLHQYIVIEQEPKGGAKPPAYWPSSGSLHVEGLSASYSKDGPKVLQNLTFEIKGGQRVGVVGRTGAGKSSLTLALLRCIPTEGSVVYDGIPTASITLDSLRSNVTIIPQVPELMGGTLRHNLDPFGQHDDATLNDALRSAGLFSLQKSDENRITLDTKIAGGGSNLSVGQRQIIALARAIVRQSKLLVLDEATSAIDYETDAVIQQSLRTELKSDVTVITVAHRLQTVMDYDMIMVLDAGRLVEFDTPKALLKKPDGLLRALVDQSADKEELYVIANRG